MPLVLSVLDDAMGYAGEESGHDFGRVGRSGPNHNSTIYGRLRAGGEAAQLEEEQNPADRHDQRDDRDEAIGMAGEEAAFPGAQEGVVGDVGRREPVEFVHRGRDFDDSIAAGLADGYVAPDLVGIERIEMADHVVEEDDLLGVIGALLRTVHRRPAYPGPGAQVGGPEVPRLLSSPPMADPSDSLAALDRARVLYEEATDGTIGIEEEFQILDPETLALTNRFEDLRDRCVEGRLGEHVAGELIASEIEVKTGRCETFDEAARTLARRRVDLLEEAAALGVAVAAVGTHPFSPWTEQRIIDTPHYRIVEGTLRYIAWRNNTFGIHVHVGVRGADRAMAVSNALRTVVPEILAASCSSPWLEGRITHLRSTRTQIFTRMFPRCGIPDVFDDWDDYDRYVRFLLETTSIREHTEIWWTVRPHQSFGTVEIRAADAQPDLHLSLGLCAFQVALVHRAMRLYDAGELPTPTRARDLEENLWRAIRWGMSDGLIDLDRRMAVPAGERVRALIEACAPEIETLGLGTYLAPLERLLDEGDRASVWKKRVEAGESMEDVFAEQVALTAESARAIVGMVP